MIPLLEVWVLNEWKQGVGTDSRFVCWDLFIHMIKWRVT